MQQQPIQNFQNQIKNPGAGFGNPLPPQGNLSSNINNM